MNTLRLHPIILSGITAFHCLAVANAQVSESPPPEIVSAWKFNSADLVVVFRYDGTFYFVDGDPAHPGMERGKFEWDKQTGAFSVDVMADTNGDAGFSHPGVATTVTVSGNTLNYTVPGEGTFGFSRVTNTASAIVGSWVIPGENFSVTFLADGTYYLCEETNDIPFGYTGIEKGSYTWNSSTKAFTATAAIDTNGDVGVNGIVLGDGVTANINGSTMVFFDGEESTTLFRITTNPTPIRLPDFGTVRFANYRQTSTANPALRAVDDLSPYSAEGFVEANVGATAPTLKIGGGTPFPMASDEDEPGYFGTEEFFSTLSALNSFLPASTVLQFKNGTSTANLTTSSSLTFPTVPKIIVRGGATWSGGVYRFGEDEGLQWTLPTGFVASQYLTNVEIYDPSANNDVFEAELHGPVTFLDLGGKLEPGKEYEVEIEFYRIDSSTNTGTGVFAGKLGNTLSASSTVFMVRSLPDTSQAPTITEQPLSQTGAPGSPLSLQVGMNEEAFASASFQWFRNGQSIDGQQGNSLFIPSFDPNVHSGIYKVLVSNSKGVAESEPAFIGSVPYAGWQSLFFTTTQLANPAVSGDDVDFDNDGIRNLLEFVLGGNPVSPDPNLLKDAGTTPAAVGRNLVFSYDRKTAANSVTQVIETSSTLTGTWTPAVHGVNGVAITTTTVDAATQRVTATIPSTATNLFVRLRAVR